MNIYRVNIGTVGIPLDGHLWGEEQWLGGRWICTSFSLPSVSLTGVRGNGPGQRREAGLGVFLIFLCIAKELLEHVDIALRQHNNQGSTYNSRPCHRGYEQTQEQRSIDSDESPHKNPIQPTLSNSRTQTPRPKIPRCHEHQTRGLVGVKQCEVVPLLQSCTTV
jgi:hypothetical protein